MIAPVPFRLQMLIAAMLMAFGSFSVDARPLPVRIVVVTAFEIGADTGDKAGNCRPGPIPIPSG